MLLLWLLLTAARPGEGDVAVGEPVLDADASAALDAARSALAERRLDTAVVQLRALADASTDADVHYWYALALYEAGELGDAESVLRRATSTAPRHAPTYNLWGLTLADLGRGTEALEALGRAETLAAGDDATTARVVLNQGVVRLDRGEVAQAERLFERAGRLAADAGATDVVELARVDLTVAAGLRGGGGSDDPLGRVIERLRRGDVAGARAEAPPAPTTGDRRAVVAAARGRGVIARAEGRIDDATLAFQEAVLAAREGGMVRDTALALGDLATAHAVADRPALAREALTEALALTEGTSFRVIEVALRAQAGLVAVALDDAASARAHLTAGRALTTEVVDVVGVARLDELEGAIARQAGELEKATVAYERALASLDGLGFTADAARVATELVRLHAGGDPETLATWSARAEDLFARAGDPLGPAHVAIATGLGLYRERDLKGALAAFGSAIAASEAAGTRRGTSVAASARAKAVVVLVALGHDASAASAAAELGLEEALARHARFEAAEAAYGAGLVAFDAGDFGEARDRFDEAWAEFRALDEAQYATTSRRARAWSAWNLAIRMAPLEAYPFYEEIAQEAIQVDDPELRVRAHGARALAAARFGHDRADALLGDAAEEAVAVGLDAVAGECEAARAEIGTDLRARAAAARHAMALLPSGDARAVYAMYSVAVDAHNAEEYALAESLSVEVLPVAGSLADAVTAVLEAARAAPR